MVTVNRVFVSLASLLIFFAWQAGPAKAGPKQDKIQIAVPTANIRSEPSRTASTVAQGKRGDTFPILSEEYGWYQIQLPDGSNGWIAGYIVAKESMGSPKSGSGITIAVNKANIRSKPERTAPVIFQAGRNEQFDVVQEKFGWYQIKLSGENLGWVAGYLTNAAATNQSHSDKRTGIVDADRVNVRNAPSLSGPVIGKIHTGKTIEVIGEQGDWVQTIFNGEKAWIHKQYVQFAEKKNDFGETFALIKKDGTNIRSGPSTTSDVIVKASEGERYPVISRKGDWYEIRTASWKEGYVAGWLISVQGQNQSAEQAASMQTPEIHNQIDTASVPVNRSGGLAGKTIILDPGHGGFDPGASSVRGIPEKQLTMSTIRLLEQKLTQAGANVRLTRSNDSYIPLQTRVFEAHRNEADAFISVHFDSSNHYGANGFTTYFYQGHQKELADHISGQLGTALPINDRGVRQGDYYVIRENSRPAVLLELGYLSNPRESELIETPAYQDLVTSNVVKGLQSYFNQ